MKKKIISIIVLVLLIGVVVWNVLNQPAQASKKNYFYLGTIIEITLYDVKDQSIFDDISDLILKYDNQLSRQIASSEINQLNNEKTLEVSNSTLELIQASIHYSEISDGNFDITIEPIVDLWKIGSEDATVPSDEAIQKALQSVDYKNIVLDGHTVTLLNDASIDLGAIAKGFIADEIVELLQENNIQSGLINLGGNVFAYGNAIDKDKWGIGIREPKIGGDVLLRIDLNNQSVVTSGIYERYLEQDGKFYHHIFDPTTGYPKANNLLSITVITDQSIDGDALSTALFNLGKEEAFKLANELGIEIIVVTNDNVITASQSLEEKIEVLKSGYELKITK